MSVGVVAHRVEKWRKTNYMGLNGLRNVVKKNPGLWGERDVELQCISDD